MAQCIVSTYHVFPQTTPKILSSFFAFFGCGTEGASQGCYHRHRETDSSTSPPNLHYDLSAPEKDVFLFPCQKDKWLSNFYYNIFYNLQ